MTPVALLHFCVAGVAQSYIGSSLVALVVLAQRGKKRSVQCHSFCSVAVDANNCRLRCGSLPKNYFILWFRLDPFSLLPGVACQWCSHAQAGSCTCGVVWHSGGDIHSRPSIRLINKISTVVKLCRIDWFFGFILCRDIAAVM